MKTFLIRRRALSLAACAAAVCLIFYVINYPAAVDASASQRQLPIYCVQRDQKLASVSFDQVKATFFVVGDWADKYPESVKALHDAGHEVMNHSNTHAHYPQLSVEEIVADLNACNDKIEAITGVRPTLVRLPYGDYDDNAVRAVRSIGMEPIQWDVDSLDWKEIPAEEIVQRVTGKVQPGSIVLFHNAALHTPEALPSILETLIQEGYTFVPISQLILDGEYNTDYTIDHTGRQCPA